MKTKAAVPFGVGRPFALMELELEGPREGDVLIRYVAAGLCHSFRFSAHGEIIRAHRHGTLAPGRLLDLATAIRTPPQRSGRTVFKSVGTAVQDWAVGDLLAYPHRMDLYR